jgi:hypothetical protein
MEWTQRPLETNPEMPRPKMVNKLPNVKLPPKRVIARGMPLPLPTGDPPLPAPFRRSVCGLPTVDDCPGDRIIALPIETLPVLEDAMVIDSAERGTRQITLEQLQALIAPVRLSAVDVDLNISTAGAENFAVVAHNLNSTSLVISLLTRIGSFWTIFGAPWRIVDSNTVRFAFNLGFYGPARAVIYAAL